MARSGSTWTWLGASLGQSTTGEQLSLLGLLVHEIGHSVGIWHSGDEVWTFDSDTEVTSMISGTDDLISQDQETIQQDDLGSVQWVDTKTVTIKRFFSDDFSFEGPFPGNWGRLDSSNVSRTASQAKHGSYSVLLTADNAGVFITSVFDPWKGHSPDDQPPLIQIPGMNPQGDGRHSIQAHTAYKKTSSGNSVEVGFQWAWIEYDPLERKETGTLGNWLPGASSYSTTVCSTNKSAWKLCSNPAVVDLDAIPDERGVFAFRARIRAADADIYIDRSGARRRDAP